MSRAHLSCWSGSQAPVPAMICAPAALNAVRRETLPGLAFGVINFIDRFKMGPHLCINLNGDSCEQDSTEQAQAVDRRIRLGSCRGGCDLGGPELSPQERTNGGHHRAGRTLSGQAGRRWRCRARRQQHRADDADRFLPGNRRSDRSGFAGSLPHRIAGGFYGRIRRRDAHGLAGCIACRRRS